MIIARTITLRGPEWTGDAKVVIQVSHNAKLGARTEANEVAERILAMLVANHDVTLSIDQERAT